MPPRPPFAPGSLFVSTVSELYAGLSDAATHTIELFEGTYSLAPTGSLHVACDLHLRAATPGQVVLDGGHAVRHLTIGYVAPVHVVLAGLVLVNGYAGAPAMGGAMLVFTGANVTLTGCTIMNCQAPTGGAGGAIALLAAALTVTGGSVIAGNIAGTGGAIFAVNASLSPPLGWAFSTVTLTGGAQIIGNMARSNAGGLFLGGGSTALVTGGAQVRSNAAVQMGGGLFLDGENTVLTVADAVVHENNSSLGGGICAVDRAKVSIVNSVVSGNRVRGSDSSGGAGSGGVSVALGGGVAVGGGARLWMVNTTVSGNAVLSSDSTTGVGGGIEAYARARVSIRQCVIRDNAAESGGGLYVEGSTSLVVEQVTFERNVVTGSGSAIWADPADALMVDVSFREHAVAFPTVHAVGPIRWRCPLGEYMPEFGRFTANFTTSTHCLHNCSAGSLAASPYHNTSMCAGFCPIGHFCGQRTIIPEACPPGTFQPIEGGRTSASCVPCSPGSYSGANASSACIGCPIGKVSESSRASACGVRGRDASRGPPQPSAALDCPPLPSTALHCPPLPSAALTALKHACSLPRLLIHACSLPPADTHVFDSL
jgi:hypothetical protein